jgi:hypothetical protein
MLKHAVAAQQRGFGIFPVARNAKVPHPAAGQWGLTATNDINAIVHFWTNVDPHANIGVACKPSQLLVIDLDVAKEDFQLRDTEWAHLHDAYGPRVNGEEVFDEMTYKLGGDAPSDLMTYSVRTRSGGLHLYYRWPAHWPRISQASPVKGIVDVRGNGGQYGGYVLAAGSVVEGAAYFAGHEMAPALPPQWIRLLVAEKPQQPRIVRPKGLMQPGAISNSGLVASVQNAGEGNRNNALVWAARTMCEEGATVESAIDTLGPAAESAGLGPMEIERTIQSAFRTQRYKDGS